MPSPASDPVPADPRPLVGEPVSMDLLNTVWIDASGRHDLLETIPGLRTWLHANGLQDAPLSESTRTALVEARHALLDHVGDPTGSPVAVARLNAVLARGASVRFLDGQAPGSRIVVKDPGQLPAWTAVDDYLQLLDRDPRRIRRCAHPDCVLHFYDTSKRGDRRWCSMAGCGNRAKAARHYARTR